MFIDAGFPEAAQTKAWSDSMIDAIALYGDESRVKERLLETFDSGAAELLVSPILAGRDKAESYYRTMRLVGEVSRTIAK
jgi:hypothetical protein